MNQRWQHRSLYAVLAALLVLMPWAAFASSQSVGQRAGGAGLFIAWAIAYLSRRRAIGGWLLYFYIQLYLSFLASLLFLPATLSNLRPSEWDSTKLYVLFIISTVPVVLLIAAEVYAATKLLVQRTEANVRILRKVLLALASASGIAFGIDLSFFEDELTLFSDVVTFVFAAIWLAYFSKAKRVQLVFIEGKWDYFSYAAKRVLTPEDRRRLRRRTWIASSATFLVLLIVTGLVHGDRKPDAFLIFFVPLFYALIAALIAWYLPLRKREADTRQAGSRSNEPHT